MAQSTMANGSNALALLTAVLLLAACVHTAEILPPSGIPDSPPAPSGYRLAPAVASSSPVLDRLRRSPRTTPVSATVAVYIAVPSVEPRPAMTLTRAIYIDSVGAMAAYNAWYAAFGFMPSAERTVLDMGDQAERFDAGWPPLHAVVARAGTRFVVAEAGDAVPLERRNALIEELARAALAESGTFVYRSPH